MTPFKSVCILLCAWATLFASAELMPTHNPFKKPAFDQPGALIAPAHAEAVRDALPIVGATLAGGSSPLAIIDGKVLGIGETVKGYKLVSIKEGLTVFEYNGKRHEVEVSSAADENEDKELAHAIN